MSGCFSKSGYEVFRAKDAALSITMEFPSGWFVREHANKKASYASVIFVERDARTPFKAVITVMAKKEADFKKDVSSSSELAQAILDARKKLPETRVLTRRTVRIAGVEAQESVLTYRALEQLYQAEPRWIQAREVVSVFKKGERYYILRYVASQKEFPRYEKAYRRAIRTLRMIP